MFGPALLVCVCVRKWGQGFLVKYQVVRLATLKGEVADFGGVIEGEARERDVTTARGYPLFSSRK